MEPHFTYWLTPGCVAYRMLTDFICWEKQGPAEASKASGLSFTADERVSRSNLQKLCVFAVSNPQMGVGIPGEPLAYCDYCGNVSELKKSAR